MPTTPEFEAAKKALNPEQRAAVETIDGPVMVIAGPGTGKTQVLALRVGEILQRTDIAPGNILCLTFTDAAAVNMRERLAALIGPTGYKVVVHTFHGFASDVIATYREFFHDGADYSPADDVARLDIIESVFRELPRHDPLASVHDDEFVYRKDAQRAITLLKQAGLTPEIFSDIIESNAKEIKRIERELSVVFSGTISRTTREKARAAIAALRMEREKDEKIFHPRASLSEAVANSLEHALRLTMETDSNKRLSEWKAKWYPPVGEGERALRDKKYLEKMRSLARVYKAYQAGMRRARLFDFDDMVLDVVQAMRNHPELRTMLEERYQYVLVDEFQDTNDAQLSLVRMLGESDIHERKPNIMIVGDDDQAIYRFQGAEISNIKDFPKPYASHRTIVLTKNYRSTQEILDVAREVIEKSDERLERVFPELSKRLVAHHADLKGNITSRVFSTPAHEYAFIAKEISRLINDGKDPREIAVITRRHRELEEIARVLVSANIPIAYERKQNVFDEPHIRSILTIARFVASLMEPDRGADEALLPEILSAPYWGISRESIWNVAIMASERSDRSWLKAMRESTDPRVRDLAMWLIDLGVRARTEPLERILDEIIGSEEGGVVDETHEVAAPLPFEQETSRRKFQSPMRRYYFGPDARKRAEARYLLFLSSLRVFVGALREYRHDQPLFLQDLVRFADIHERNDIPLADTTPFRSALGAVNLLSAHKAKGLEFDTVFITSAQEEVWAGRGKETLLPFPMNLRDIEPDEGKDDRLRLFYVALTRAKRHLYVTRYRQTMTGKESLKVRFIAPDDPKGAIAKHFTELDERVDDSDIIGSIEVMPTRPEFFPIVPGERAIILSLLEGYRLSVTHLNNFLNVMDAGPAVFLEQNLLQFPQSMRPSSVYGSAMHKAIELFYREYTRTKRIPSKERLVEYFREEMSRARLPESERRHFLAAGERALPVWWNTRGKFIDTRHRSETDFRGQGVVVEGVPLVGKIDKMIEDGKTMHVYDFKTGKAKSSWNGKDAREQVLMHGYKRQLIFYKLLVEHSHDFRDYTVDMGTLEFIEPVGDAIATLDYVITKEDTQRLSALIRAVYTRILALDFPDIEKYSKDLDGVLAFEEDLLA
jgi:DNA helicase-2/ATP-dependent DNA helicase PcrA